MWLIITSTQKCSIVKKNLMTKFKIIKKELRIICVQCKVYFEISTWLSFFLMSEHGLVNVWTLYELSFRNQIEYFWWKRLLQDHGLGPKTIDTTLMHGGPLKFLIFFFCAVIIANGRFFIVIRAAQVLVGRINQTYIKIIFIYLKKIKIMVLKTRGMPIKLDVNWIWLN